MGNNDYNRAVCGCGAVRTRSTAVGPWAQWSTARTATWRLHHAPHTTGMVYVGCDLGPTSETKHCADPTVCAMDDDSGLMFMRKGRAVANTPRRATTCAMELRHRQRHCYRQPPQKKNYGNSQTLERVPWLMARRAPWTRQAVLTCRPRYMLKL